MRVRLELHDAVQVRMVVVGNVVNVLSVDTQVLGVALVLERLLVNQDEVANGEKLVAKLVGLGHVEE